MRILLIKTSSLGDVVHNLPVVTDLRRHFPTARIDWVVEEAFADIPRLHPGVNEVIPVAMRRWRRGLTSQATRNEFGALRKRLRSARYNLAIDTQGLIKSALITHLAQARRCGYAWRSAREPLASRFYDERHAVSRELHAVERNRRLAALCAGYAVDGPPDYGIAIAGTPATLAGTGDGPDISGSPYAVLLTATSRDDKLWPESSWVALGLALRARGIASRLPAGTPSELQRAQRIAAQIPDAAALAPSRLGDLAYRIAGAALVVGVDTGLVHLGAAMGRPTLALFAASDPALTGVLASTPTVNLGARGQPPSVDAATAAVGELL